MIIVIKIKIKRSFSLQTIEGDYKQTYSKNLLRINKLRQVKLMFSYKIRQGGDNKKSFMFKFTMLFQTGCFA